MTAVVAELDTAQRRGEAAPEPILRQLEMLLTEAAEELQDGIDALLGDFCEAPGPPPLN